MKFLRVGGTLILLLTLTSSARAIEGGESVGPDEHRGVYGFKAEVPTGPWESAQPFGLCTAFLVHPRLLLTAAHCLEKANRLNGLTNANHIGKARAGDSELKPLRYKGNPAYRTLPEKPTVKETAAARLVDIGFITLREDAPSQNILPVFVSRTAEDMNGLNFRIATVVGYGASTWRPDGDFAKAPLGVKRKGIQKIFGIDTGGALFFSSLANAPLPGDSGGPVILDFDGVEKAVALNHMVGGTRKRDGTYEYVGSVETLLTKENLCWVIRESGISIPDVSCAE